MEYELIRSGRKTIAAQIKDGKLIIRAPQRAAKKDIESFISRHKEWIETHLSKSREREKERENVHKLSEYEIKKLSESAKLYIPARVAYYAPKVGVTYGKITIRRQKSRWGSCSSNGNLSFNFLLMLTPPDVIDSVVIHELCHRKVMNHSADFYAELYRVYPNYDVCSEWLKKNGALIMAMIKE